MITHTASVLVALSILSQPVFAHPGRTASDGCHYCRTRCDYWGEVWNARHCHGGGGYTAPSIPNCPANSYRSGSSCTCTHGYAPSLDKRRCIKIPEHAHRGNGITDVWECDDGYRESGNYCIAEVKPAAEEPRMEYRDFQQQSDEQIPAEIEMAQKLQKEAGSSAESKQTGSGLGSFCLGVVTVAGGYWLYKRRKRSR